MKMSEQGRNALMAREGCILHAYEDSVDVLTIGVGHTAAAGSPVPQPGMKITQKEAEDILARDLVKFENYINDAVHVPLAQNEFDALVSVCFNVGPKFAQSTAVKLLNKGDRKGAADAILWWNKPPEIVNRRKSEQRQFLTPYKGQNQVAPAQSPAPQPAPVRPVAPLPVPPKVDLPKPGQYGAQPDLAPTFLGRLANLFKPKG